MKRKVLNLTIGIGSLILVCWGITTQTMLLKCQSDSLSSIGYLVVKKGAFFERGDIVCFQGHKPQYVKGNKPLGKRILGIPGDQIQKVGSVIKVIPSPFILPLLKQTSKGEPLSPLSFTIIPEGYVFVAGDHPKSFDSRYDEFGLVNIENIRGRAIWWW